MPTLQKRDFDFTSKDVAVASGIVDVSNRTVRRAMNRCGYKYMNLRKKGMLLEDDFLLRKAWAQECRQKLPVNFWQQGVSMYYDGVGFEYKRNPAESCKGNRTRGWRRLDQGLDHGCTSKGKKEGKRNAKFFVGISYNKGASLCIPYTQPMDADSYVKIILPKLEYGFKISNNPKARRLLQDNCPVQNARAVKEQLAQNGVSIFKIPARSPDVNPVENFFSAVRRALQADAKRRSITSETFTEFQRRCVKVMKGVSVVSVNKLIDSMWNRVDEVIRREGQRIRY